MKKTNLIFVLICLVAVTIISCKKEKSSTPAPTSNPPTASIVGTWTWVKLYGCNDGNTAPTEADTISISSSGSRQLTFASAGSYNATWSYAQMGSPPASNSDNGIYTAGDSLIMTSNISAKMCRGKIYKLTANELWYRYFIYNGSVYEVRFGR
ncbi:MAG: hypothetical protein ACT4ON_11120 [Bacteroidota bacterium]